MAGYGQNLGYISGPGYDAANGNTMPNGGYGGNTNPFAMANWGTTGGSTGNSSMSASASSTGPTSPHITAPSLGQFNYSAQSQNYPTYLRNLGENQAQQSFQNQVNQGIRLGNSASGYQHAMDARNQSRLGYMGQAGQQELAIQQLLAAEVQKRNDELLRQYASQITERGQDVGYQASLNSNLMRNGGGGGQLQITGGNRGQASGGGGGGSFIDMFGNRSTGGFQDPMFGLGAGQSTSGGYGGGYGGSSGYSAGGTYSGGDSFGNYMQNGGA